MNRLMRNLAPLALLAALAFPALAQTPAEAEQRAAIKELLDVINFKQMFKQMNEAMRQQMPQMIAGMMEGAVKSSKLPPEKRGEALRLAREMQDGALDKMLAVYNDPEVVRAMEDTMARAYARHFTTEEIRATTAFYRSPAGAKALTLTPKIMQETMPEIMSVISPKLQAIMEGVVKDAVARAESSAPARP